jgi:geranylgeranyl reductase family protein
MPKKVVIIGAGVIGLSLAKVLAKHGIETIVYDAKRKVSDNTAKASGIFSKDGLSRTGIRYHSAVVNTLDGAKVQAGKESMRIKSPATKAYVLDRGKLAEICANEAAEAGAVLELGRRIDREAVRNMCADKQNVVVGADGAVSTVASAMGFPPIKEHILTYKAEYEEAEVEDRHMVGLYFSNKIANRFFGWYVPYSDSKVEVGIGVSGRAKKTSTKAFEQFLESDMLSPIIGGARRTAGYASMIPVSQRARTVKGNVLLVGDAAGQVKATTGGGIIFGIACAHIAARVIREHITQGKPLESYEKLWRKRYGLDLGLHRLIHSYYSSLGEHEMEWMIKFSRMMGAERFLGKYGDMDSPTLVIKRFFLRRRAKP